MCYTRENQIMTNDERNRTTESRKNQNAQKKGYLKILEADTIKQVEMEENIKKKNPKKTQNTSGERENYSKTNYIEEISLKRKKPCVVHLVRYSGLFLSGRGKNLNKWTREQENL